MNGKMIIACKDEDYLMMLVQKFYYELDSNININAISDYEYLLQYMNNEKMEERLLILGREYYLDNLDVSKFDCIVLLDENEKLMNVVNGKFLVINPFLKIDVIYDFITSQTPLKEVVEKNNKKDTELIAVYSPIGGSGKTTVAYGLCIAFSKAYKKVLYINPGTLQDFGYLFNNPECLEPRVERMIARQDAETVASLMEEIRNYGFDFVPPTRMSLATLDIRLKDYVYVITELKRINQYDYIVVDMMSELSVEMAQIIGQADQIICVGLQSEYSAFRMKRFLQNIDGSDLSRYLLICNKYNRQVKDYINEVTDEDILIKVKEYIDYMPDMEQTNKISDYMLKALEQISMHCI